MALNIKNEDTVELISRLAKATGQNMTQAVTSAVRERLARIEKQHGERLSERLLKIGKKCSANLRGRARSIDHGELLYDDKGLPR
jgi:antitoxin VapB